MNNKEIWDKLRTPPSSALKQIKGGRLSGMTDIKPQWRYDVMTEVFGPCGIGWHYTIEKIWTEPGSADQKMIFAEVTLSYKVGEEWSRPINAIGGSMLITKESSGLHTSDEGPKMAVTDALGTAMKMIGVGADIHMGLWDGSKYKDSEETKKEEKKETKKEEKKEALLTELELCEKFNSSKNIHELKNRKIKYAEDYKALPTDSQATCKDVYNIRLAELEAPI